MFNKVILVGNLTRDIELRYIGSGSALANTAMATNRRYNVNGEKKEEVCFIDITFWGRTAEIANQYLKKGSKVLIEGRLKFDQWQDQNGQNRSKHSITVETMQMLSDTNTPMQGGNKNFQTNSEGYNNYSNNNYGSTNYANQGQQNRSNFGNSNQSNNTQDYSDYDNSYGEDIPDIDVNADMGDEELPF